MSGVECSEDFYLIGRTGETSRSGFCNNQNAYTAKVTADGTLAQLKVVQSFYQMGWFDGPVFSVGPTQTIPSFKQNYLFVREQPLLVGWTKY